MGAPSKEEKARMDAHLRRHGLGGLDDPSILDQLAFFVRSHEKFRDMLMKVEPGERANAYRALAPRISFFKPKTLEQYEIEGRQLAENLPTFDPVSWAVSESKAANISEEAKQAITGKSVEERNQEKLTTRAEDAISEDLGKSKASGRLHIICRKCTFGTTVYATDRADAYRTLIAMSWKISGDHAYCPTCGPDVTDRH